jgi:hypothetical protein
MQPVAIYAAAVDDLDRPVSKSTIKNELRRRLTMVPLELRQDGDSGYSLIEPAREREYSTWPSESNGPPR